MTEKTAEEKLREELEGKLSELHHEKEAGDSEPVRKPVKPRAMRSRTAGRKTEKPVNVGQRVDSFMEDFERRIAESLNAGNVFGVRSSRGGLRTEDERKTADESSAELGGMRTEGSREPAKDAFVKTVKRRRRKPEESGLTPKLEKIEHDVLGLATIVESPEAEQNMHTTIEPETVPESPQPELAPESQSTPEVSQPAPESQPTHETPHPEPEAQPTPEPPQPAPESQPTHETPHPEPEAQPTPEPPQPAPESQPTPEVSQPALESQHTPEVSQPAPDSLPIPESPQPEPESQHTPEVSQPMPESQEILETPEIPDTDTDVDSIAQDDDSLDDIPVEIVNESEQDIDDEFPDVPVIDAQEIAESSDNPEENTFPDIPVISPQPEEIDDDFTDITNIDDDIHEFSEEPEDTSTAKENTSDFTPFADVVVNVDADLPQINSDSLETYSDEYSQENIDPENQASPVTVTMPASTKTAEDKLMANIAEAMTGNPLSLDKPNPSEPYRLPDNLLNPPNDPNSSPQSAEEKLIADISQAISESPIETVQNQAHQNFESDINPFDEMPLPEPISTPDFDDNYEQEEGDDFDEPFLPDFSTEKTQQESSAEETLDSGIADEDVLDSTIADEDAPDSDVTEGFDSLTGGLDTEDIPDPFSIPDDTDNTDETTDLSGTQDDEDTDELPDSFSLLDDDDSSDSQNPSEDTEDLSDMPDLSLLNEPENDSDSPNPEHPEPQNDLQDVNLDETPEPDLQPRPDSQPITAEARLAQELADFQNHEDQNHEDTEPHTEPEYSLIDEPDTLQAPNTSEDDSSEEFDFMSSWGDAASTMNYGDDEHDPQEQDQEHDTQPQEIFSQPTMPTISAFEPAAKITHSSANVPEPEIPESQQPVQKYSPVWRTLLQAVLGLLILAGVFSLFRLHQLTDTITGMMLYGNTSAGVSAQSYDYAVDLIPDSELSSRMRLRGIEGWKIVGSRRTQDTTTGRYGYEFIFMRQKPGNL